MLYNVRVCAMCISVSDPDPDGSDLFADPGPDFKNPDPSVFGFNLL